MFRYRTAARGHRTLYREAGYVSQPTPLLHDFPSFSHRFRELIPLAADNFTFSSRPNFGAVVPTRPIGRTFKFIFDDFARAILGPTETSGLERYAICVFDRTRRQSWRKRFG
jgi:hypothetical protein